MGKYDSYIIQKILFLGSIIIFHVLWSSHRIYYAAINMFKIYDSNSVDSNDDEDHYLSESSHGEDN